MNCIRCIGYTLCCCCICCIEELYYDEEDDRSNHTDRHSVYSNASNNSNTSARAVSSNPRYSRLDSNDEEEGGSISNSSPESIHTPLLEGEHDVL